jgi:radical SAM-linked protein
MWYTKGFNPHAKIVFSTPLSVGAQSVCEMVDIRIDRDMPCDEIKRLLNLEVTEELRILEEYRPTTKFSDIIWASYEINVHEEGIASTAQAIRDVINEDKLPAIKKTKSGEKEVDILPLIKELSVCNNEKSNQITIKAILCIDADRYLNPELLLSVIQEKTGILKNDEAWYSILRTATYLEDGVTRFQ